MTTVNTVEVNKYNVTVNSDLQTLTVAVQPNTNQVTVALAQGDYSSTDFNTDFSAKTSDDLTEGTTNLYMSTAEQTKLAGIETGATADQTGAEIKSLYEAEANAFTDAQFTKLAGIESGATADQTGAEIKTALFAESDTNNLTDALLTKLNGIETGATADQTGSEIKSLYEAEANTNAFTDALQTKLSSIETGATADQTDAEIKTAYENNADTNAFTDAEKTKLAGIETGADVTDTANVTAAGAVMDSELTDETAVKAINQGLATTDSPSFVAVTTDVTGTVSSIANHDTGDLAEGSNLYYTDARARSAISLTSSNTSELSYNSTTGVFQYVSPKIGRAHV